MTDLQELAAAKLNIEQFAPKRPESDKPFRIGVRLVPIYVIPVSYVDNQQIIEVRLG